MPPRFCTHTSNMNIRTADAVTEISPQHRGLLSNSSPFVPVLYVVSDVRNNRNSFEPARSLEIKIAVSIELDEFPPWCSARKSSANSVNRFFSFGRLMDVARKENLCALRFDIFERRVISSIAILRNIPRNGCPKSLLRSLTLSLCAPTVALGFERRRIRNIKI